jgi:hypothetical protein
MSRFYANIHVRDESREQILEHLFNLRGEPESMEEEVNVASLRDAQMLSHAHSEESRMLLSPSINGWVSIFIEEFIEGDEIAENLSELTDDWTVFLWADPEQAWGYSIFRAGEESDEFVNDLSYYDGTVDEHDEDQLSGNPDLYSELLESPNTLNDLKNILELARHESMKDEEESQERRSERVANEFRMFSESLGIPHAATDYQYIIQGDQEDLLRWDEFVHVTF